MNASFFPHCSLSSVCVLLSAAFMDFEVLNGGVKVKRLCSLGGPRLEPHYRGRVMSFVAGQSDIFCGHRALTADD
jgi:hypothetical protein